VGGDSRGGIEERRAGKQEKRDMKRLRRKIRGRAWGTKKERDFKEEEKRLINV